MKNTEIETAQAILEKIHRHNMTDATIYATNNEHNIIETAKQIAQRLKSLARDYAAMEESFADHGETVLYGISNDLPELKSRLKTLKEARNFYAELLK